MTARAPMKPQTLTIPAPAPWAIHERHPLRQRDEFKQSTCDNRSAPAGATNTLRGLTRSSGTSREGLA